MQLNEAQLKQEFDQEVTTLVDRLGVDGMPKYAFRVHEGPNSHMIPRTWRRPIVEIGRDVIDHPYVLAAEAAHIVFSYQRNQLGLRDHPGYGEVFDFMNQVIRMAEDGEHELAEENRTSFGSIEPFIAEYEQIARRPSPIRQVGDLFQRQSDRYGGESNAHILGMAYIRLAFGTGMKEPEHIAQFLNSLVKREADCLEARMNGDFMGVLGDFNYFRQEPVKIMKQN